MSTNPEKPLFTRRQVLAAGAAGVGGAFLTALGIACRGSAPRAAAGAEPELEKTPTEQPFPTAKPTEVPAAPTAIPPTETPLPTESQISGGEKTIRKRTQRI